MAVNAQRMALVNITQSLLGKANGQSHVKRTCGRGSTCKVKRLLRGAGVGW